MNSPWVTERLALTALDYPIPQRANRLDFMLGALTLVALTLLALTGIVGDLQYLSARPQPVGYRAHDVGDCAFADWWRVAVAPTWRDADRSG